MPRAHTCADPLLEGSEVLGEQTQFLELRMQALLEQEDSELLHHAALLGKLSVITEYLDKYPNEVKRSLLYTIHIVQYCCIYIVCVFSCSIKFYHACMRTMKM